MDEKRCMCSCQIIVRIISLSQFLPIEANFAVLLVDIIKRKEIGGKVMFA